MELPDILKRSSPAFWNKWPQVVRGELPAGLGDGLLHLVEGVCGGAGEELAEEEAMCMEDGAEDGEASRSPNSILHETVLSSVTSLLCTSASKVVSVSPQKSEAVHLLPALFEGC